MSNSDDTFQRTMQSKAALDAASAVKLYMELVENGWPSDRAFQVAFMGIKLTCIPGLKPLPEPDPPFALSSLYEAVKVAHANVSALKIRVEDDLKFLHGLIRQQLKDQH